MPAADHSCVRSGSNDKNEYRPRNPEDSLLYRTIAAHLETFLGRQQECGREVRQFVEREMRSYLSCGVLACGFLRLKSESCGKERLLPLSCKGRSVCPSCCGRRMADTAAHLVDRVFPHVPARQWVLSVPFALRYRLAYDAEMVTAVLGVFIRALFGLYRRMARDYGIDQTQCGAVTFVQRFGSAANLHLHFHVIAIDGVYAPGLDGKPQFFCLTASGEQ
jgi:Transposase zinc-binding domain/Putative transposase